jgi:hypothetical protein
MDTTLHLNRSSSVVQRMLRLRALIEQSDSQVEKEPSSPFTLQANPNYQRQSWQKSDSSLNLEPGQTHRCG